MYSNYQKYPFTRDVSEEVPHCAWDGCANAAHFKAPHPSLRYSDITAIEAEKPTYQYFCAQHIAAFNQAWDYFAAMSEAEIEDFMKEAVTGHRRTKPVQTHLHTANMQELLLQKAMQLYGADSAVDAVERNPSLPPDIRHALQQLHFSTMPDAATLKAQWRRLAKQHHPDAATGDEQLFHAAKEAYVTLKSFLESE